MVCKVNNPSAWMKSQILSKFEFAVYVLEKIEEIESTPVLKNSGGKLTKREIYVLIFDCCLGCDRMAAVPQGAFAVRKVRKIMILKIEQREGDGNHHSSGFKNDSASSRELMPLKYNSKLMNSIWGLYNRYSVHNFKKNTDPEADTCTSVFTAALEGLFDDKTSKAAASAEVVANAAAAKH